jgi:hypothetical protein
MQDQRAVVESKLEVRKVVESGARVMWTFEHFLDASNFFDEVCKIERPWYTGSVLQIVRVDVVDGGDVVEYVLYRKVI